MGTSDIQDRNFVGNPFSAYIQAVSQTVVVGDNDFVVPIRIMCDGAYNITGVSFKLNYPVNSILEVNKSAGNDGVEKGSLFSNGQIAVRANTPGVVEVGLTLTGGYLQSLSGEIALVHFKLNGGVPNTIYTLSFSEQKIALAGVSAIEPTAINGAITVYPTGGVSVWPGDLNNDGKVDVSDILQIGIFWNLTGPERTCHPPAEEITWQAHSATPWDTLAATYADANGDGVIDQYDILPIGQNYSLTHTRRGRSFAIDVNDPRLKKYRKQFEMLYDFLKTTPDAGPTGEMKELLRKILKER
jgi:hypothetical protein